MFSCKYRGAIFTCGAVFWGFVNVQVSLYEAEQRAETLRMSESTIEAIRPNIIGVQNQAQKWSSV